MADTLRPDDTVDELIEFINRYNFKAKREVPVVGEWLDRPPTPWGKRHAQINEKLTLLEAARDRDRLALEASLPA